MMDRAKPSMFRRVERRVVSGGMGVVAFFLERVLLRATRKAQSQPARPRLLAPGDVQDEAER